MPCVSMYVSTEKNVFMYGLSAGNLLMEYASDIKRQKYIIIIVISKIIGKIIGMVKMMFFRSRLFLKIKFINII